MDSLEIPKANQLNMARAMTVNINLEVVDLTNRYQQSSEHVINSEEFKLKVDLKLQMFNSRLLFKIYKKKKELAKAVQQALSKAVLDAKNESEEVQKAKK